MSQSGPGSDKLNEIAQQAERDLNTYQSKTGTGKGRASGLEDFGVNDTIDRKFPGADVKVGENLITNASYDRQIPADEGGDVDEKGRFLRGSAYEGAGGPEDKTAQVYKQKAGSIDEADVKARGKDPRELGTRDRSELLPSDQVLGGRGREPAHQGDMSEQGRLASKANLGMPANSREEVPSQGSKGSEYRGEYYETPEFVQDQYAEQGEIPPESVVERSKNI